MTLFSGSFNRFFILNKVYRNGMKTLNILTNFELKQIFGPLEDILLLHEGRILLELKYNET